MEWVICPVCSEIVPMDGPDGWAVHLIAFHENAELTQALMRVLSRLPLPENA